MRFGTLCYSSLPVKIAFNFGGSAMKTKTITIMVLAVTLLLGPILAIAEQDETEWNNTLKNQYFSGKTIEESNNIIELDAPIRAEDPALVPLKINTKIKQTNDS
jgi:sulfur-oxidizing protein SoxY